ncbi:hypothetical protein OROMI_011338 [Orobanche minor]
MVLMVSANGAAEALTLVADFIKGDRAMRSIFTLLDRTTKIELDDADGFTVLDQIRGEIEFKYAECFNSLGFESQGTELAKLWLSSDQVYVKSSVVELIHRFYEPCSKRLIVDGKDISMYNLKSLR